MEADTMIHTIDIATTGEQWVKVDPWNLIGTIILELGPVGVGNIGHIPGNIE